MSNYDATVAGFLVGVASCVCLATLIIKITVPAISQGDLYRFCLVNGISLPECKIPPEPFKPTNHPGGQK